MADEPTYQLSFLPSFDEWDLAMSTVRRLTGVETKQRMIGVALLAVALLGAVVGLLSVRNGTTVAALLVVVCALLGWFGAQLVGDGASARARRRFFDAHRPLQLPTTMVVSSTDVFGGTALASHRVTWDFFAAYVELPDILVLTDNLSRVGSITVLPRRGLADPDEWAGLVDLVSSHVAEQPTTRPR